MEVKWLEVTVMGNGSIGLLQALFFAILVYAKKRKKLKKSWCCTITWCSQNGTDVLK